jgi:TonB-dependent starch-binding outer membrane protein SusC
MIKSGKRAAKFIQSAIFLIVVFALNVSGNGTFTRYEIDNRQAEPETVLQSLQVTGRVLGPDGLSLPGVTVLVKGTTTGTVTNIDGVYNLTVPNANSVLSFSFVGYTTQEVAVGNQREINITLQPDLLRLDEVVVVGYGTMRKSDLTGSVMRVRGEDFRAQSMTQVSEMLAGTIAGFNLNQGTTAAGGGSGLEVRGPTSITAGTSPLIVLDGVIFYGSLRDINPNDIESIDILKDASSAAVFGAKAASGVVLITTTKGRTGKPTINFSSRLGATHSYNERRELGPDEFILFRQSYFRQLFADRDFHFYTHPDELPSDVSVDQWRTMSATPLADNVDEWMTRMRFFPEEQLAYRTGETISWYDEVFRTGLRQDYDLSIAGGTDEAAYYWSIGYNNNEGIRVGDQYSSIRSRINADYSVVDWLKVGLNAQYSDRDESSVPVNLNYASSPFAQMYDENGNLKRYPHGHTDNPFLDYFRTSRFNKRNSLFASLYADINLPLGFNFRVSYQPRYENYKYLNFITISERLGGFPATENPSGRRDESTRFAWMIDNLLTWDGSFGDHNFNLTFLANIEEDQYWYSRMDNRNFTPNQQLIFHGLHYGDSPEIIVEDTRSTGDALMGRLNYSFNGKYLLTTSIRRDGYSAFGIENPRAVFPAAAIAWVLSEENFFNVEPVNWLKLRASWGVNGNRDIGIYSALAGTSSSLLYDGFRTNVGVNTTSLANASLRWERTEALNLGIDMGLLDNRVYITADVYDMTTTDLLLDRELPRVTGFNNITSNLGELQNRGFEITVDTRNLNRPNFSWRSNFLFSLNRNKIIRLWEDTGEYTLLGETHSGELPDFTNQWFPGQALDVVWDYNVTGIWQLNEAAEAARYGLEPGDFKAVDVNGDGSYVNFDDKHFIGYTAPRHRLGFRNDVTFLGNFTASIFIRADLGHVGSYNVALNRGYESNDRWNRNVGPVPYWTADRPNDEYARLNTNIAAFGGGIMIYKPRSYVRIQDISLTYNIPASLIRRAQINDMQLFTSVRNLATFTKWPGWDPESGMNPMPRTFTFGLNLSL